MVYWNLIGILLELMDNLLIFYWNILELLYSYWNFAGKYLNSVSFSECVPYVNL